MSLVKTTLIRVLVASGLLLAGQLSAFAVSNIWLTATSNNNPWPGTSSAPFYAGDATAFTAILSTNKPNCTFHYAAGRYQTTGFSWETHITANLGCKHLGAGVGKTIIQLVGVPAPAGGIIFGTDNDALMDGFEVRDMTLDCNAVGNPTYLQHAASCTAVIVAGSNIVLSNLLVIGFGTGNPSVECFPVQIAPIFEPQNGRTNIENVLVENCIFTSPAPTNAYTITACSIGGYPQYCLSNTVIRSCTISNLAGYQGFYAPVVENCLVDGCKFGYYCEPGWQDEAHRDWIVRSNTFKNCDIAVYVNSGPGKRIKSLTIEGNQFQVPCKASSAFTFNGMTPPQGEGIDWLVLRNNTVYDSGCTNAGNTGFMLAGASQLVVQNNRMILPSGVGLRLMSSVTNTWFSGNINGTGSALTVNSWPSGVAYSQAAATRWTNVIPPPVSARIQSVH